MFAFSILKNSSIIFKKLLSLRRKRHFLPYSLWSFETSLTAEAARLKLKESSQGGWERELMASAQEPQLLR